MKVVLKYTDRKSSTLKNCLNYLICWLTPVWHSWQVTSLCFFNLKIGTLNCELRLYAYCWLWNLLLKSMSVLDCVFLFKWKLKHLVSQLFCSVYTNHYLYSPNMTALNIICCCIFLPVRPYVNITDVNNVLEILQSEKIDFIPRGKWTCLRNVCSSVVSSVHFSQMVV